MPAAAADGTLDSVLSQIRDRATTLDRTGQWPALELTALAGAGAMRWAVPAEFEGDGLGPLDLHLRYEQVAHASLAVALVLTQRDSAVGLIDEFGPGELRRTMLPRLAANDLFATVGISQITTSRQGGLPALAAEGASDGLWRVNGYIPWCTGAPSAAVIVAGAVTNDGRQMLVALPGGTCAGVTVGAPLPLVALRSTCTAPVTCEEVTLGEGFVLRGPVDRALAGRTRSLPLGQAFLAFGVGRAALGLIAGHDSDAARDARARLNEQFTTLRNTVVALSQPGREAEATEAAPRLRGAVNDLVLRITHSAVALYKGTALLADHPAQRLAREALFLLVWSCPNPVIDCTVDLLANP